MTERLSVTEIKKHRWGKWFSEHLKLAGYKSQEDFAKVTGFSRPQIQRWAAGEVRPRETNMETIAQCLDSVATPEEVYEAAGYLLSNSHEYKRSPASDGDRQRDELNYETDDENIPTIQGLYEGLPADDQDELMQIALMKWRKKREQETTHGKRTDKDKNKE